MPFVKVIAGELREEAIKLHRAANKEGASTWDIAYRHGFFHALGKVFPSETVGMLIADCDLALEGEPLLTDQIPRLVVR
jgi:hypothetical protein